MVERGTSKELKLIVEEVSSRFAQFKPCRYLSLCVVYGGMKREFMKEIMFCTTEKSRRHRQQIIGKCHLTADYQSFKKIYLELNDYDYYDLGNRRSLCLKFGIIDRRDSWIWYTSGNTGTSMEARTDPNKEYVLSLKDVLKNILKTLYIGIDGVRVTLLSPGIPMDGAYVYIFDLNENDKRFLLKKTLPFLVSLSKSGLKWLSYV